MRVWYRSQCSQVLGPPRGEERAPLVGAGRASCSLWPGLDRRHRVSKPGAVRNFSWLRAWPVIALSACKNGSPNDSDMNKHFNEPSTVLKHWSESVRSGCILGARGTVKGRAGTSMPHAKHRSGQRRSPNSDQPPLRPRRPDGPPEDHVPPGDHDQSASPSMRAHHASHKYWCGFRTMFKMFSKVLAVSSSTGGIQKHGACASLMYWRDS